MSKMTRTEARALTAFQNKVLRACYSVEPKLSPRLLAHARANWLSCIRACVSGNTRGGILIHEIEQALGDEK